MSERVVAITGATGFVGCRTAERLVLAGGYEVVALVRRFSGPGLARLARLPVRLVQADVMDPGAVASALEGADVVVHCAYGTSGTPEERERVTVQGTAHVLSGAASAGVGRVIHLSTAAVHGTGGGRAMLDESAPFTRHPTPYEAAKIEAERVVWASHREHGVPVLVFRPTLVYGPYGRRWTVRIIQEILEGAMLVDEGAGAANLVYIDNLVDALLRAIGSRVESGDAFIVVDDDRVTWRDVYEAYARFIPSAPPFRSASVDEIARLRRRLEPGPLRSSIVTPLALVPQLVRASVGPKKIRRELKRIPWVRWLRETLPETVVDRIKGSGRDIGGSTEAVENDGRALRLPDPQLTELLASRTRFDNHKLKTVLAHRQRVTFDEAMRRIEAWAEYQRLLPGPGTRANGGSEP